MIDIQLFRNGIESLNALKRSQEKRFASTEIIDEIFNLDSLCRTKTFDLDQKRKTSSQTAKNVADLRKSGQNAEKLENELKTAKLNIKAEEKELKSDLERRNALLSQVGNIVHDQVPVSNDENENAVLRTWGAETLPKNDGELRHHHDLLYMIGGYEPDRGVRVAGHRGYFLTGPGVLLNMALQQLGLQFLAQRGYTPVQPPCLMNQAPMAQTCQLSQFDEELFRVAGAEGEAPKYLIATSEQPLSALHQGEWLQPRELPLRYAGLSVCFRKEAGAHGKDAWGVFRVHQFEKVEQFVICAPDESWAFHEEMIKTSEEFYKLLGLPYRVVSIVSGALNNAAAMKFDLEAHFPTLDRFRELVSCSNCTDYQSRGLEIRYGHAGAKLGNEKKEKSYVHMLNSTLCATTRTICCILENYQTADGVKVPPALVPFCGHKDFFPFVRKAVRKIPLK